MKTVADQFAETLAAAGVKRIYGIVGDSLNGLTDSVRRQGKIQWMHVRHEEVAAFAAGAEAHLTGDIAVCAGSCGPGNLHLINGLFDCTGPACRCWPSPRIFRPPRSASATSRKRIRKICSGNAAISANWSLAPTRCRAPSKSRSAPPWAARRVRHRDTRRRGAAAGAGRAGGETGHPAGAQDGHRPRAVRTGAAGRHAEWRTPGDGAVRVRVPGGA